MSDDLRIAVRRLWQQPGFSLVAIATLALGLGANITIITLLHTLLLRSLPVERPHELYRLGDNDNCCNNSGLQGDFSLFSYPLFRHLEREIPGFSELAGFQANTQPIGVRRSSDRVATSYPSQYVTGNYFSMFGVVPAAGRLLRPDDDRPDAVPVVAISHRIWMRDFGGDRSIVGASFVVNGRPMTLAGVTAEGFFGDTVRPDPTGLWIPIGQEPAVRGPASAPERPGQHWMYAIGRARSPADATAISTAATTALQAWLGVQAFTTDRDRPNLPRQRVPVVPAGGGVEIVRIAFSQSLTVLLITSGLVLLIACANLANLLLARADRGQAAIRAVLGASAQRLMRQSLTEGIVLSLAGGAVALLLATAGTRTLVGLAFPGAGYVPVDATPSPAVRLFGLALAVVTGAIFSAAPAWAMARTQSLDALHGVGRSGHERSFIPRRSLVVAQVALSLILLTGAGLLGRSLGNLEGQTLGFEPDARR